MDAVDGGSSTMADIAGVERDFRLKPRIRKPYFISVSFWRVAHPLRLLQRVGHS
jgi:hypothetical protein